jgi:uncharacterized caspase-like protein/WD40 repeat protein
MNNTLLKSGFSFLFLLLIFKSNAQVVDKLRLVFEEKEIVSKQVGVTVSNDGRLAAFAYENQIVKVVNLSNGKTLTKFKASYSSLFDIRFSSDSKKIITASDQKQIAIYDVDQGKQEQSFSVNSEITKIDVSKLGSYVAVGQNDAYFTVYDLVKKINVLDVKLTKHHISAIDFNPIKNEVTVAQTFSSRSIYAKDKENLITYDLDKGTSKILNTKGRYASIVYSTDGNKLYGVGTVKNKMYYNPLLMSLGWAWIWTPRNKDAVTYYDFNQNKRMIVYKKLSFSQSSTYSSAEIKDNFLLSSKEGNSFDVMNLNTKEKKYTTKNDNNSKIKKYGNYSTFGVGKNRIYPLSDGIHFLINSFDNNICQIYNIEKNSIDAYIYSDANDDFVVVGRDGRLDGSQDAIAKLAWHEKDNSSKKDVPLENTFNQFYTPNLLSQLIKGVQMTEVKIDINNLKPLPEIKITNPNVDEPITFRGTTSVSLETNETKFKFEFNATDMGGGLGEERVYQNGKLIYTGQENIKQLNQNLKKSIDVELTSGNNEFKVVVTNNDKIESSKSTIIKCTAISSEPAKLFLFVIGINKYEKETYNLGFAIPDATSFTEAIQTASKDLFSEVNVTFIKDKEATKANILKQFEQLKPIIKKNDVFVFYYAGHGAMSVAAEGEQSVFHLVPSDVTNFYSKEMLKEKGVSTADLQQISKDVNAQKQLFVIDACQSGGAVEGIVNTRGVMNEKELANLARSTGTYFLTASGSDQLAGEFAALGHGVFTYAILQALTGKADATNGDNKVSVKELSLYVENAVPNLSEQYKGQRQFPVSYGYGQDFPLVLNGKYAMKDVADSKLGKYSSLSLEELVKLKQDALQKEDYDVAKEIKEEIEKRKNGN